MQAGESSRETCRRKILDLSEKVGERCVLLGEEQDFMTDIEKQSGTALSRYWIQASNLSTHSVVSHTFQKGRPSNKLVRTKSTSKHAQVGTSTAST